MSGHDTIRLTQNEDGSFSEAEEFSFTMEDLWQTDDPPKDGWYIVTLGRVVGLAIWEAGKWWESPHDTTNEVKAWMPVPQPYRE